MRLYDGKTTVTRCSTIVTCCICMICVTIVGLPRALGYHDHTIAVAQEVLGRFALFASLLNAATAIAVFIVDPSYKSVWLDAAIVLPFFVVCLTPAIAVAAVDPRVLAPWRLSSNPLHTIAGRSPFLEVPCGQTSGTMGC